MFHSRCKAAAESWCSIPTFISWSIKHRRMASFHFPHHMEEKKKTKKNLAPWLKWLSRQQNHIKSLARHPTEPQKRLWYQLTNHHCHRHRHHHHHHHRQIRFPSYPFQQFLSIVSALLWFDHSSLRVGCPWIVSLFVTTILLRTPWHVKQTGYFEGSELQQKNLLFKSHSWDKLSWVHRIILFFH